LHDTVGDHATAVDMVEDGTGPHKRRSLAGLGEDVILTTSA